MLPSAKQTPYKPTKAKDIPPHHIHAQVHRNTMIKLEVRYQLSNHKQTSNNPQGKSTVEGRLTPPVLHSTTTSARYTVLLRCTPLFTIVHKQKNTFDYQPHPSAALIVQSALLTYSPSKLIYLNTPELTTWSTWDYCTCNCIDTQSPLNSSKQSLANRSETRGAPQPIVQKPTVVVLNIGPCGGSADSTRYHTDVTNITAKMCHACLST